MPMRSATKETLATIGTQEFFINLFPVIIYDTYLPCKEEDWN